ncbi:M48 family metallopeptidase [Acinetobacter lanii]|uniref:M48 family metallopeptidase n=1 Tax=Acinetobacter lanii TaxID=2715163 RepID=A0A6G8S6C6_9GAMM|nr:M48 family metallopeptidase [Acinetobacter lanii]QIO09661.1 M48 family metallopeptidase [Acinetobacter lanii]
MQSVPVTYYDGVISKPHQATLHPFDADHVVVKYRQDELNDQSESSARYHRDQITFIGALGQRHPVIELDNDARIEFHQQTVPDWLPIDHGSFHHKVWKLERTPSLILLSVVFVLALGFAVLKWGVPSAAKMIAYQLPENTLNRIGKQAESFVNDQTQPSKLSKVRQEQIKALYVNQVAQGKPADLKFREGDGLGANALALPNNTIIVTDELIKLTQDDNEILGVLAHEQAHLLKRHSLQQALTSLGISVLYIAITGDSSDLMTTVPLAVVGAGYSRKFEQESDLYAVNLMHAQQIDTTHFANFLQRLSDDAKEDESGGSLLNVFSSHPATAERIKMVRDFQASHAN